MTASMMFAIWSATLLLGSGVWVAVAGWPRYAADRWCALGGGWIVGAAACGMLVRALAAHSLAAVPVRVGCCAAIAGALCWAIAWWTRRPVAALPAPTPAVRRGDRVWIALLLALLAWRGWILFDDVLLHPTLPWDAWAVWLGKAKTWVLVGRIEPSVSYEAWVGHPIAATRTGVAWMYPELIPWMAVWMAAGTHWIEPLIGLLWFGLGVAVLMLHYGQWRALGVRSLAACAGTYALGSMPLLDAHVALGGYADLWIAAVLSMGAHAWLRWSCLGERRQIGIVVIAMVLLPLLKLEGSVWSIILGLACLFRVLPSHLRARRFLIGAGALLLIVIACVALGLPWIGVARRYLDTGRFFDLGQIGVSAASLVSALWAQWNWNLLWFALPIALWWNRKRWLQSRMTRRLVVFVALPFAVMLGLFLFTSAARYAQSYSAVNRLLLQITPLLVSVLVLALRAPDVEGASTAQPEPESSNATA